MSTEFCSRCKQSHPGRVCDYDDKGDCAETDPQPETLTVKPAAPAKEAPVRSRPASDRA